MADHAAQPGLSAILRSRTGLVLLGFLAIAGLMLVYEHRAHIFVGSWFLIALPLLCPLLHIFMHGGHGGHGGHDGHRDRPLAEFKDTYRRYMFEVPAVTPRLRRQTSRPTTHERGHG